MVVLSDLDSILEEIDTPFEDEMEDFSGEELASLPKVTAPSLIRETLAPEMTEEEISAYLQGALAEMSAEEAEGFWNSLGKIAGNVGRTLVKAAPDILPAVGGAIGTVYAPGVGTALGTTLGSLAGKTVGSATAGPAQPPASTPVRSTPGSPAAASPLPAGASSAVAQLLALIQNPVFLKSLIGQLSGVKGSVAVGTAGRSAPFGSMMNALRELAEACAMEANDTLAGHDSQPEYLYEETGEPVCDTTLPEERARALLTLLREGQLADMARRAPGRWRDDPLEALFDQGE